MIPAFSAKIIHPKHICKSDKAVSPHHHITDLQHEKILFTFVAVKQCFFTELRSYLITHLHMKHCIIIICLLASFIGGIQAQTSKSYSIESAVRFIELARAAEPFRS